MPWRQDSSFHVGGQRARSVLEKEREQEVLAPLLPPRKFLCHVCPTLDIFFSLIHFLQQLILHGLLLELKFEFSSRIFYVCRSAILYVFLSVRKSEGSDM